MASRACLNCPWVLVSNSINTLYKKKGGGWYQQEKGKACQYNLWLEHSWKVGDVVISLHRQRKKMNLNFPHPELLYKSTATAAAISSGGFVN